MMWPFKKRSPVTVSAPKEPLQRLPDEVLDKLLHLIKTGDVVGRLDLGKGVGSTVNGVIDITDYEGIMIIRIDDQEIYLRRRWDKDYRMVCDALNARLRPTKVLSFERDYSGFNEKVMVL